MISRKLLPLLFPLAALAGEWVSLFDGKTPAGWRTQSKPAFPSHAWNIEDGALHSIPTAPRVDLSTAGSYRNFELEFDWKIGRGANSGVKYLVFGMRPNPLVGRIDPEVPKALGLELQLIDDEKEPDARVHPSHATGAMYLFKAASNLPPLPVDTWHKAKIVVDGRKVEHWLDGRKVLTADLESAELRAAMEAQKRPDIPKPHHLDELKTNPAKRYPLVLTHHGGHAWFKNIRLRELP